MRSMCAFALAALTVAGTTADACTASDDGCTTTTTAVVYTGIPTIVCQAGVDVIEITSTASCRSAGAGPVVEYRCADDDTPFFYESGGYRHKIGVTTTWGDLVNDCSVLIYRAGKVR